MRALLVILLISACSLVVQAQSEYVFLIKDQNGNALPFVHLQVENTLKGAVADADGYASIRLSDAFLNYPLLISHVGYETKILQFETQSTQQINDVILLPSEKELDNINVIDIGISPNDFMKMVAENLEANFYGKSYEALGYYQEKTFENEELSLEIEAELLLEAEGLNKMFGKNKYRNNDNAYLVKLIDTEGEQKFHTGHELYKYNYPELDHEIFDDSFLDWVFSRKADLERQLVFNPEAIWERATWRFINLESIGDEKYVLVRHDKSNEAENALLEYWVNIEDFKIRQINFIGKRDYVAERDKSTEDLPKRIAKKIGTKPRSEREYYTADATYKMTLNYFDVDNLLYLKRVDLEQVTNYILGEKKVAKKGIASFSVEELDPDIKKKDLMPTRDFLERKWWAK